MACASKGASVGSWSPSAAGNCEASADFAPRLMCRASSWRCTWSFGTLSGEPWSKLLVRDCMSLTTTQVCAALPEGGVRRPMSEPSCATTPYRLLVRALDVSMGI